MREKRSHSSADAAGLALKTPIRRPEACICVLTGLRTRVISVKWEGRHFGGKGRGKDEAAEIC